MVYPAESQMEKLANDVRRAGGRPTVAPAVPATLSTHYTPDIGRVHMAVEGGHITSEEGMDLNPKYNPANKRYNSTQASKIKARERDPIGDLTKRRALYQKRKARLKDGGN